MSKTALHIVASFDSLNSAWKAIQSRSSPRSRNTVGVDGVSINDFAIDSKPRLRILSQKLRDVSFAFSALKPHFVPKPNGKFRPICVPTVEDRIVQRALLDFLNGKYGARFANAISFGFIKDRTVKQAAERACYLRGIKGWAFKTDISAFFDRVDRQLLHARLKAVVRQTTLHPILIAASNCEIHVSNSTVKKRLAELGIITGKGVRQGMPLSPFFANLFLEPFDQSISKRKLPAVRYADDLIFFGSSQAECEEIDAYCRSRLDELKLDIPLLEPGTKTVIEPPDQPVEFLGLGLVKLNDKYQLMLMEKQREAIRADLLKMGSIPDLHSRGITLASLDRVISSRIAGYSHAYACCSNSDEFDEILKGLHQTILRRVYGPEGLGLRIESLSSANKAFLGLV